MRTQGSDTNIRPDIRQFVMLAGDARVGARRWRSCRCFHAVEGHRYLAEGGRPQGPATDRRGYSWGTVCRSAPAGGSQPVAGLHATAKKKVRVSAAPMCSRGLRIGVRIVAEATGAPRKVFTRTYRVDARPAVPCPISGTG